MEDIGDKWFVLARPRSRTAWFTEALNRLGAKAGHDSSCQVSTIKDLSTLDVDVIVDTALAVHWKQLPLDKIVVIDRPLEECIDSSYKAFNTSPSALFIGVDEAVNEMLEANVTSIKYKDLSDYSKFNEIVNTLVGKSCSKEQHDALDKEYVVVDVEQETERFNYYAQNINSLYGDYLSC